MIRPRGNPDKRAKTYRTLLQAYYTALDAVDAMRAEQQNSSVTLRDRIALAAVRQELTDSIASCQRGLSKIARLGGHGIVSGSLQ